MKRTKQTAQISLPVIKHIYHMKHYSFHHLLYAFVSLLGLASCATDQHSPNGLLTLNHETTDNGQQTFTLHYRTVQTEVTAMEIPTIGITTDNGRGSNIQLKQVKGPRRHTDSYTMLTGKRRQCHNEANEYTYIYEDSLGKEVRLVMRLYNDGLAFRYEMDDLNDDLVTDEHTTYHIADGRQRWIQKFELGYEEYYHPHTSPTQGINHWIYPALIEQTDGIYTLITEANIEKGHAASSMRSNGEDYKISLAKNDGPRHTGDWTSPWRVLIIGTLADIVESTLVTDVSTPSLIPDAPEWVIPGCASWVYWAHNRGSKDYQIVSQYIDMAHTLELPYVLIDWEWDIMENGGDINDAIAKADSFGVRPLVWYNSSTAWTIGAGGPLFRLNKPEDREREFAWLADMGVAGVKIDFFDGDTRATMDYCIDLLESAARHHLLVNFHGATLPRGWQRTYPNLVSVEAVYGAEWYNNTHRFTNRAAAHNATLPFTRNVVGSMDYTPCAFSDSQHPHITTHAHELALTVLYESGVQHLADRPESYLAQPSEVQQFLSQLPTVWDDTKLLSGYPGQWTAMARRDGNDWYVGIINGLDKEQNITVDWSFLGKGSYMVKTFADVDNEPRAWDINAQNSAIATDMPATIQLAPRGGFVAVFTQE